MSWPGAPMSRNMPYSVMLTWIGADAELLLQRPVVGRCDRNVARLSMPSSCQMNTSGSVPVDFANWRKSADRNGRHAASPGPPIRAGARPCRAYTSWILSWTAFQSARKMSFMFVQSAYQLPASGSLNGISRYFSGCADCVATASVTNSTTSR